MPSKKASKAAGNAKKKAKGQQLLISRFFSKSPQQAKPKKGIASEASEKKETVEHVDELRKPAVSRPVTSPDVGKSSGHGPARATQTPEDSSEREQNRLRGVPEKQAIDKAAEKSSVNSKLVTPPREKQCREDDEADTPTTAVLHTPTSSGNVVASSQSDDDGPPATRKRRRLFIEDADSESDCERTKKKKSKSEDPDFEMAASAEPSDSDVSMEVVPEEDSDVDTGAESGPEDAPKREEKTSQSRTTLGSYGLQRGEDTRPMPRNEKQRKRFTQKIGRLEKNSFFLRRTGGGGDQEKNQPPSGKQTAVKYTPLESQYVKLRKLYPDMFLLVECGYKYRMFEKDAGAASKVLRVASFFSHNFLTASFPTHRLAHHVRNLVAAGYKVGVISQSETAALKKASAKSSGLFERKLSAVYTKGTIAADGKLVGDAAKGISVANTASYIMSICELKANKESTISASQIAIAAVDTASGEVFFDCFDNDDLCSDLESRLVAIEPVEILMTKKVCTKMVEQVVKAYCESMSCRLERMPSSKFNPDLVCSTLKACVDKDGTPEKTSVELSLSCLGALISYLEQFKLELSMTAALEYKCFRSKRQMKIGADVLRNFEVFGNSNDGGVEGSLSGLINRTQTSFGSRQMRQWLSHPLTNAVEIKKRLDAVEYLRDRVDEISARHDDSITLDNAVIALVNSMARLPDLERGLTRITCRRCTPAEFVHVTSAMEEVGRKIDHIKSLSHSSDFPNLLSTLFSSTPAVVETLDCGVMQILNSGAATENRLHALFEQEVAAMGVLGKEEGASSFLEILEELTKSNEDLTTAEKGMNKLLRKLREKHSNPRWEWKKVGQDEYLLEVPSNKASSMPRSWTVVSQTKAVKRFRPREAEDGYERIQCARETRDAVATRCWASYLDVFSKIAATLRAVVRTLTDLDCLASLARVANLPGYTKPDVETDTGKPAGMSAKDARHPLTEVLDTCISYVPNDVNLGRGSNEIAVVISGPNYGGKSSYARMTALVAILAQIGSYVPAKALNISPFDSIHARMGSSDSISKGMSSLMVELAETSRILRTATSRSLVVLDELGRGTSTHDGSAIAYATLSHLVEKTKCTTLCVTHFPMLAGLRQSYPGLVKACFMNYRQEAQDNCEQDNQEEQMTAPSTKITFLYKLTEGVASSSYGLNVARLAGIPSGVIDEARSKALEMETRMEDIKREAHWSEVLSEDRWHTDTQARNLLNHIARL